MLQQFVSKFKIYVVFHWNAGIIFISATIEWLLQMWMNTCFEILNFIVCYAKIQKD